jgi:hypothetical protein
VVDLVITAGQITAVAVSTTVVDLVVKLTRLLTLMVPLKLPLLIPTAPLKLILLTLMVLLKLILLILTVLLKLILSMSMVPLRLPPLTVTELPRLIPSLLRPLTTTAHLRPLLSLPQLHQPKTPMVHPKLPLLLPARLPMIMAIPVVPLSELEAVSENRKNFPHQMPIVETQYKLQ